MISALVAGCAGAVDHLVQNHPAIGRQAERGAVDKADAARGVGAGLDEIALENAVADLEHDDDAIPRRGRHAGYGFHATNRRPSALALGLGVLRQVGSRQNIDDIARDDGAVGRLKTVALRGGEISPR